MILGLGVDLCPVERLSRIDRRYGHLFLDRVFTENEQAYAGDGVNRGERLAARFAAKEATIKALGAPSGLRWRDMEVTNASSGAPSLELHGAARDYAKKMGVRRQLITISHAGGMAVAVVVLEGGADYVEP